MKKIIVFRPEGIRLIFSVTENTCFFVNLNDMTNVNFTSEVMNAGVKCMTVQDSYKLMKGLHEFVNNEDVKFVIDENDAGIVQFDGNKDRYMEILSLDDFKFE